VVGLLVVLGAVLGAVLLNRGGSAAPAVTTVAVPDVTNQDANTATQTLQNAGLKIGRSTPVASTAQQKGLVVSTDPAGGAQVPRGTAVSLNVGSGPDALAVPDVTGKTASQAVALLKGAGFTGNIDQEPTDSLTTKGRVVESDPAAGAQAAPGDTITLKISSGTIAMPDVTGKTEAAARQALVAAGFSQNQITSTAVERDDVAQGSVAGTDPAAGTPVGAGGTINLQIAQPTPPATTTTTTPASPTSSAATTTAASTTTSTASAHP
jgi:serine/threonine-protein kinase